MRLRRRELLKIGAATGAFGLNGGKLAWGAATFCDPLNCTALSYDRLERRPLQGLAYAGKTIVAVGLRGLIIRSNDEGATWSQSPCPVQSDLLSVNFPTSTLGWAVGHDGIVLHSADGGKSWAKQMDGIQSAPRFLEIASSKGATPGMRATLKLLRENEQVPGSLPFLAVRFWGGKSGLAVGSFGMAARTNDGGQTWQPALQDFEKLLGLNLNAITGSGLIAAERGVVYRPAGEGRRYVPVQTAAKGSFYGAIDVRDKAVVYGLRGEIASSPDGGVTWQTMASPTSWSIFAGCVLGAGDGFLVVDSIGQTFYSSFSGTSFAALRPGPQVTQVGEPTSAIACVDGKSVLIAGLHGVRKVTVF